MLRLCQCCLAVVVIAGCQNTRPHPQATENENRNLHGIVEEQQHRIDDLTAEKASLDRRVRELEAQIARADSTEKVVESAKEEMSEHVRKMIERFRGDSDIEVESLPGGYRFVVRESVLFDTASAQLTAEGRQALQRVADALRGGSRRILIEGHTDDVPVKKESTLQKFPRGNMDLSVHRALSVWDFFVADGKVDRKRVAVCGFGAHRPRVPNTSDTNRWRNRRVEIRVEDR